MADPCDMGSEREEISRQEALDRVRYRPLEAPLLDEEYRRICRDCECLIPSARLAAVPHAVRCASCQEEHEGGK
ncbi:TraR/DksA C4-type zinc finger protein [Mariprofundus ferrooxydans]|uniref:Zinc finger DksA/TraR C4-type domain-containing protein n=1 Tax=Mariprofundus ferrooxydans PV-1 TaxID=314345 RepID=Q0EWC9_9PROT|nr:TraR/DksA C4-type zinc finger protein [Mariprofundus ferrooxydans]EAU53542.1 hypothetical protein SPV1_02853 [Mariprofundus ferrooxydans PV-1]